MNERDLSEDAPSGTLATDFVENLSLREIPPNPPHQENQKRVRVLTYNTWLLPWVAPQVDQRLRLLPAALASTGADFIALQEVWEERHAAFLCREMAQLGYPTMVREPPVSNWRRGLSALQGLRGFKGSGLMTFSRFSLAASPAFMKFSHATAAEEWFVSKGALLACFEIPGWGKVDLVNAHLGSVDYLRAEKCFDPAQRKRQQWQLAELQEFIHQHSPFHARRACLVALDANAHLDLWDSRTEQFRSGFRTPTYQKFCSELKLMDSFHDHSGSTFNRSHHGPHIYTYDRLNPHVQKGFFKSAPSEFLDYIYVKRDGRLEPKHSSLALFAPEPTLSAPLSDHYGLLSEFELGDRKEIQITHRAVA